MCIEGEKLPLMLGNLSAGIVSVLVDMIMTSSAVIFFKSQVSILTGLWDKRERDCKPQEQEILRKWKTKCVPSSTEPLYVKSVKSHIENKGFKQETFAQVREKQLIYHIGLFLTTDKIIKKKKRWILMLLFWFLLLLSVF